MTIGRTTAAGQPVQVVGLGDRDDADERTGIDEGVLRQIADKTGGRFFRARDTAELAGIYREIDQLEPAADQSERYRPVRELFHLPLAAALLLALLPLLDPRRYAWLLAGRAT